MDELEASIIVCTHNRAHMLPECLASLLNDRSPVAREIVVVDNASTDRTREVLARFQEDADPGPFRIRFEPRLGKSHALNTGVEAAAGRILVFADDDVVVEDGWLGALLAPFRDPSVGAVGGRTLPRWPSPPPDWLQGDHADLVAMHDWGAVEGAFSPGFVPAGNNMAIRKDAIQGLDRVFDPDLGPRGSECIPGEDNETLFRIRRRWTIWYAPLARVEHRITGERITWAAMCRQHFRSGIGHSRVQRKLGEGRVSLVRRVLRLGKAILRVRMRNRGKPEPHDPNEASARLEAYLGLGYALEGMFGSLPPLAAWIERRLQPFPTTG